MAVDEVHPGARNYKKLVGGRHLQQNRDGIKRNFMSR